MDFLLGLALGAAVLAVIWLVKATAGPAPAPPPHPRLCREDWWKRGEDPPDWEE